MANFPNETKAYREARDELLKAELDLRENVERVAALRRSLPMGGVLKEDYLFSRTGDEGPQDVSLSELFAEGQDTLFVYSFMFAQSPCPMCTAFMDGLDGQIPHIQANVSVAVVAKNEPEVLSEYAATRGWKNVQFLSSLNNTFNVDYLAETNGGQNGMAHVFVKRDGAIHHFWSSEMHFAGSIEGGNPRHVDQIWPLWNVLDLTPDGRKQWFPSLAY